MLSLLQKTVQFELNYAVLWFFSSYTEGTLSRFTYSQSNPPVKSSPFWFPPVWCFITRIYCLTGIQHYSLLTLASTSLKPQFWISVSLPFIYVGFSSLNVSRQTPATKQDQPNHQPHSTIINIYNKLPGSFLLQARFDA